MVNDTLEQMVKAFNSDSEKQAFMEAQHQQIVRLSKEIKELKKENIELQVAIREKDKIPVKFDNIDPNLTDEESICLVQIALLQRTSIERELTSEEVKKLEILSKVLTNVKNRSAKSKSNQEMDDIEQMSDKELEAALKELNG